MLMTKNSAKLTFLRGILLLRPSFGTSEKGQDGCSGPTYLGVRNGQFNTLNFGAQRVRVRRERTGDHTVTIS